MTLKRTPLKRGSKQLKRSGFKTKTALAPKKRTTVPKQAKKRKEKTQAQLKKDLDTIFSIYIRKIYPKVCYTCGKSSDRLQCGHYISRQYLVTRWSIDNCRPQCWGCNGYGKGQPLIFEENLKKELGDEYVEKMKASRHQILKLDRHWYREQIEKYQRLIKEVDNSKS